MSRFQIRTDLAMEKSEKFADDQVEIPGVRIEQEEHETLALSTTRVIIEDDHAARLMEREIGTYITLEAKALPVSDAAYHHQIAKLLARYLRELLPEEYTSVLVLGLGNAQITPDRLGPAIVEKLHINRHLILEYGSDDGCTVMISGLACGVMAQTGMETSDILSGVIHTTKPDVLIAIDALAARNTHRLGCTIQLTDTGIHPGAGVGNNRKGLSKKTVGIPVIGIGVPTVVDAGTICYDAISKLLNSLEESEIDDFLDEFISPSLWQMYVTPKDIDQTIALLAATISEGINRALIQPS